MPERPFVSLSEALSAAAFGISLNGPDLVEVLSAGLLVDIFRDPVSRLHQFAVDLLDEASAGHLQVFGGYAEGLMDRAPVEVTLIEPTKLLAFRSYDLYDDLLFFGEAAPFSPEDLFDKAFPESGRGDLFRKVQFAKNEVERWRIRAEASVGRRANTIDRPRLPAVPESLLAEWYASLNEEQRLAPELALLAAAKDRFPSNFISRDRIRGLRPPLPRGRPVNRGKTSAN